MKPQSASRENRPKRRGNRGPLNQLANQMARFGAVGLINTAATFAVIYGLMLFTSCSPELANFVGYGTGFAISFVLNKKWTFAHTGHSRDALPRYVALGAGSYLVNLGALALCLHVGGINRYVAQIVGGGSYSLCMFMGCRTMIFQNPGLLSADKRGS